MENSNLPPSRRSKQKRRIWPVLLLLFCFLIAAVAGAMFASSSLLDSGKSGDKELERQFKEEGIIKATDKATVLIMGVDKREDDVGRSDTLMIATLDPHLNQAALLSIPRDTRVKIRGYGYDKINAAFAYGGERLTESTVESFLGVDIDHYVIVNTKSFVKIIDALGGIDINVEKRMLYEDPWDDDGGLVIDLYPGEQHMDGKTAVTYVRYRDEEGDIGRVKRQQAFMSACMDKVTSPDIIPRIPAILREVLDAVETDMSFRQLLELAGALKDAHQNGLETAMVPGRPLYIEGISYWIPDVEQLRMSVAQALGITIDPLLKERFEKAAYEYKSSIPSGAQEVPEGAENIGRPVRDYSRNRPSSQRENKTLNDYEQNDSSTEENYENRRKDNFDNEEYGYESDSRSSSSRRRETQNYSDDDISSRRTSENSVPRIERRELPETVDEPFAAPTRGENSSKR